MRKNTFAKKVGSLFLAFVVAFTMLAPSTAMAGTDKLHDNGSVSAEAAEKDAPEIKSVKKHSDFFSSYYRVEFKEDSSDFIKAMKSEDASITANGQRLKKVSSFFGDKESYKFSSDSSYL